MVNRPPYSSRIFRGTLLRCRFFRRKHGKNDRKLQFDDPSYELPFLGIGSSRRRVHDKAD